LQHKVAAQDQASTAPLLSFETDRIMADPEATPEMPGVEPPQSADGEVKKQFALDNPASEVVAGMYLRTACCMSSGQFMHGIYAA